jgi:hypothetical protein
MNTTNYSFSDKDQNDFNIIENLYRQYFSFLCFIAEKIIHDSKLAESLVNQVFIEIWKEKDTNLLVSSPKKYLGTKVIKLALSTAIKEVRSKQKFSEVF